MSSVHLDLHQVQGDCCLLFSGAELTLEKLTLKAVHNQTTVGCLPAVLRHSPNLRSLHITGIGQAGHLLRTLPGLTKVLHTTDTYKMKTKMYCLFINLFYSYCIWFLYLLLLVIYWLVTCFFFLPNKSIIYKNRHVNYFKKNWIIITFTF